MSSSSVPKVTCAVRCCSNSNKTGNVEFYTIGKDHDKKQWDIQIGKNVVKGTRVCEIHFTNDDFEIKTKTLHGRERRVLKPSAVPSAYLKPEDFKLQFRTPTSYNDFGCLIAGCLNTMNKNLDIEFYSVPKDSAQRIAWELKIKREDLTSVMRICDKHFEDKYFEPLTYQFGRHRRPLKQAAIPSINLFPKTAGAGKSASTNPTTLSKQQRYYRRQTCAIANCYNTRETPGIDCYGISENRREQFQHVFEDAEWYERGIRPFICSVHFNDDDFQGKEPNTLGKEGYRRKLKRNVKPSKSLYKKEVEADENQEDPLRVIITQNLNEFTRATKNHCSVKGCYVTSHSTKFVLYNVPSDPRRRAEWRTQAGNENARIICSRHFIDTDFENVRHSAGGKSRRKLKSEATPSKNLPARIGQNIPTFLNLVSVILTISPLVQQKLEELTRYCFAGWREARVGIVTSSKYLHQIIDFSGRTTTPPEEIARSILHLSGKGITTPEMQMGIDSEEKIRHLYCRLLGIEKDDTLFKVGLVLKAMLAIFGCTPDMLIPYLNAAVEFKTCTTKRVKENHMLQPAQPGQGGKFLRDDFGDNDKPLRLKRTSKEFSQLIGQGNCLDVDYIDICLYYQEDQDDVPYVMAGKNGVNEQENSLWKRTPPKRCELFVERIYKAELEEAYKARNVEQKVVTFWLQHVLPELRNKIESGENVNLPFSLDNLEVIEQEEEEASAEAAASAITPRVTRSRGIVQKPPAAVTSPPPSPFRGIGFGGSRYIPQKFAQQVADVDILNKAMDKYEALAEAERYVPSLSIPDNIDESNEDMSPHELVDLQLAIQRSTTDTGATNLTQDMNVATLDASDNQPGPSQPVKRSRKLRRAPPPPNIPPPPPLPPSTLRGLGHKKDTRNPLPLPLAPNIPPRTSSLRAGASTVNMTAQLPLRPPPPLTFRGAAAAVNMRSQLTTPSPYDAPPTPPPRTSSLAARKRGIAITQATTVNPNVYGASSLPFIPGYTMPQIHQKKSKSSTQPSATITRAPSDSDDDMMRDKENAGEDDDANDDDGDDDEWKPDSSAMRDGDLQATQQHAASVRYQTVNTHELTQMFSNVLDLDSPTSTSSLIQMSQHIQQKYNREKWGCAPDLNEIRQDARVHDSTFNLEHTMQQLRLEPTLQPTNAPTQSMPKPLPSTPWYSHFGSKYRSYKQKKEQKIKLERLEYDECLRKATDVTEIEKSKQEDKEFWKSVAAEEPPWMQKLRGSKQVAKSTTTMFPSALSSYSMHRSTPAYQRTDTYPKRDSWHQPSQQPSALSSFTQMMDRQKNSAFTALPGSTGHRAISESSAFSRSQPTTRSLEYDPRRPYGQLALPKP